MANLKTEISVTDLLFLKYSDQQHAIVSNWASALKLGKSRFKLQLFRQIT